MFQDFCASFLGYVREEFKKQLVSALVVAAVFGRYRSLAFLFWLGISVSAFTFQMTSLRALTRKLVSKSHIPLSVPDSVLEASDPGSAGTPRASV